VTARLTVDAEAWIGTLGGPACWVVCDELEFISVWVLLETEAVVSTLASSTQRKFCFECRDASVYQDSCAVDDRLTRRSTR
jgi:hypothetical protein